MRFFFVLTLLLLAVANVAAADLESPNPAGAATTKSRDDEAPNRLEELGSAVSLAGQTNASMETKALLNLLDVDNAAQVEVQRWIDDVEAMTNSVARNTAQKLLQDRIEKRFDLVRRAYERFISRHPSNAPVRLAYGSFLGDLGEEADAADQWEVARKLDPKNPAAWNNLANYYGHRGPVTNSFVYYQRAIELNPLESVYLQNFATTVFLFRKDAQEFWNIDEQGVFTKALELYEKARLVNPTNFILASDIAQTYYGIKPPAKGTPDQLAAHEEQIVGKAMAAWTNAWKLAGGPVEDEGIRVHLARWNIRAKKFQDARDHLEKITGDVYQEIRKRLTRNLADKEREMLK